MKTLTIHTSYYNEDDHNDGAWEPFDTDSQTYTVDDFRDEDLDETGEWVLNDDVTTAVAMLSGRAMFWATEASSSSAEAAAGDNPWYMAETEYCYLTGNRIERSACLSGFQPDETRAIYYALFPRR